jgi:hypothetical protein
MLLGGTHGSPLGTQQDPIRRFHDDVFGTDSIRQTAVPGMHLWGGNSNNISNLKVQLSMLLMPLTVRVTGVTHKVHRCDFAGDPVERGASIGVWDLGHKLAPIIQSEKESLVVVPFREFLDADT